MFGPILHAVGPFILTIFKYIEPYSTVRIGAVISTTVLSIALIHFDPEVFLHPILSKADYVNVSMLVIDTCGNSPCAGKHQFV